MDVVRRRRRERAKRGRWVRMWDFRDFWGEESFGEGRWEWERMRRGGRRRMG